MPYLLFDISCQSIDPMKKETWPSVFTLWREKQKVYIYVCYMMNAEKLINESLPCQKLSGFFLGGKEQKESLERINGDSTDHGGDLLQGEGSVMIMIMHLCHPFCSLVPFLLV